MPIRATSRARRALVAFAMLGALASDAIAVSALVAPLVAVPATAGAQPPARRTPPPRPTPRGVPWWADSARWDARVVRRRDVRHAERVVDAGDTLALVAPTLPAALPDSLRARGVRWASDDGSVATVDATGRVVARAPGRAHVSAWTVAGTTTTPLVVRPVVRGHARDLDGRPLAGIVVAARAGGDTWRDSARTDATGAFRLAIPPAHVDDALDVRLASADGTRLDARFPALAARDAHRLDVALLPARWTIRGGSYDGRTVPLRPADALRTRFWRLTREGHAVGWPDESPLPTTVLGADGAPVASIDSVAFWTIADSLAADWGRPLFRPAAPAQALVVVRIVPTLGEAGLTDASWDGDGTIPAAHVALRGRGFLYHDRRVVAHELLHALGFGHTTLWPSLLHPVRQTPRATPEDVAHGQVVEAMRRLRRRGLPVVGLEAAGR
jgi:hypothetical protein